MLGALEMSPKTRANMLRSVQSECDDGWLPCPLAVARGGKMRDRKNIKATKAVLAETNGSGIRESDME